MRIAFLSLPAALIALSGCEKPAIHTLEDRIDKLEKPGSEDGDGLEGRVDELEGALTSALEEIESLKAAGETVAAEVDALEANQVTATDLDGYATEAWVEDQAYGTAESVASNTEALAALETRVAALEGSALTSADLEGYATEDWVSSQGYASSTDLASTQADVIAARDDIDALSTRVDSIEADYVTETDLSDIETGLSALTTLVGSLDEEFATATELGELEAALGSLTTLVESLGEEYVTVSTLDATRLDVSESWSIGPSESADFADLYEALEAANELRIHPDAYLYLQLEPGIHTYTETIHIKHRDGANIYIEGDIDDPSAVELQFSGTGTGIQLDVGARLGVLRGLTLTGSGAETAYGLFVLRGSVAQIDALHMENWGTAGIHVAYGGVVYGGDQETVLENNGHYGALAQYGSVLAFNAVEANNNDTTGIALLWNSAGAARGTFDDNGNTGASALWGSVADYQLSEANHNTAFGFAAQYGGLIHAQDSLADSSQNGFFAGSSSFIYASNSIATNHSVYGYRADWLSFIIALGTTAEGVLGGYEGPDSVDLADGAIIIR